MFRSFICFFSLQKSHSTNFALIQNFEFFLSVVQSDLLRRHRVDLTYYSLKRIVLIPVYKEPENKNGQQLLAPTQNDCVTESSIIVLSGDTYAVRESKTDQAHDNVSIELDDGSRETNHEAFNTVRDTLGKKHRGGNE